MRTVEVELKIPEYGASNAMQALSRIILSGLYIVEAHYSKLFTPHELTVKIKTVYSNTEPEKFLEIIEKKYSRVKLILDKYRVPYRLNRITVNLEDNMTEAEKLVLEDLASRKVAEALSEEHEEQEAVPV